MDDVATTDTPALLVDMHGTPEPLPIGRLLRGGVWSAELHGADLRDVRYAGAPVLQRVYVAVRDPRWNTVPGAVRSTAVHEADDGFTVDLEVEHRHGEVTVRWTGQAAARGDRLSLAMDAGVDGHLDYAKIGFNLHHPQASAGARFVARGPDGTAAGVLPAHVVPQRLVDGRLTAMFAPFDHLELTTDEVTVAFAFDGDLFEMQDHRNWTDANFKTYGTPLSVPLPLHASPGERLSQSVTVTVRGRTPRRRSARASRSGSELVVSVRDLEPTGTTMPAVGTWAGPSAPQTPLDVEVAQEPTWRPSFVRVDVDVRADQDHPEHLLRRALAVAGACGSELELGVRTPPGEHRADVLEPFLRALTGLLARPSGSPAVRRVVVVEGHDIYANTAGSTPGELVAAATRALDGLAPSVRPALVVGTEQGYADLARDWPAVVASVRERGADAVAFGVSPAVHADDDLSLLENARGARAPLVTLRDRLPGVPVHVGPVTLRTRSGPYPSARPTVGGPGGDARVRSQLGAAWAAVTLATMASAGARSVSMFAMSGPGGLWLDDESRPVPAPVVRVLLDAAGLAGAPVLATDDDDRLGLLAVRRDDTVELMLANTTPAPLVVTLDVPLVGRFLDATNGSAVTRDGRTTQVRLGQWAYARLTTAAIPGS